MYSPSFYFLSDIRMPCYVNSGGWMVRILHFPPHFGRFPCKKSIIGL